MGVRVSARCSAGEVGEGGLEAGAAGRGGASDAVEALGAEAGALLGTAGDHRRALQACGVV
jgi:hypothetical protein